MNRLTFNIQVSETKIKNILKNVKWVGQVYTYVLITILLFVT